MEEVVRKRYQFICLTGFRKQYFPKQYFQIGKKNGIFLRDFHISVLVCFHFHSSRFKSEYDKWVRVVCKKYLGDI